MMMARACVLLDDGHLGLPSVPARGFPFVVYRRATKGLRGSGVTEGLRRVTGFQGLRRGYGRGRGLVGYEGVMDGLGCLVDTEELQNRKITHINASHDEKYL